MVTVLSEYDDQFVPTLIPCSAASLRLKNIWLPRMDRNVELPKVCKVFITPGDEVAVSPAMEKAETHMTLESVVRIIFRSENVETDKPK